MDRKLPARVSEALETRTLLAANITAGVQFSTDGTTFSDDLSVTAGDEVIVRINYDNTGDDNASNAQAGITLPAGVSLVADSTRTALTPSGSETVTNTDTGQSGAIDESTVWSGTTLTISPQAGLYAQPVDATSGTLEIGKLRYLNLHDGHYFNGADRFFVSADPDIVGTNVSNTVDASAAAAGTVGAYGLAGQELRVLDLLGNRYLNYHEIHYNFFSDHIYRDADGTGTSASNVADTVFSGNGTAGAFILHPDSHVQAFDLYGNRFLNLHEGRYISGGDLISLNIATGVSNASDSADTMALSPATYLTYSLQDSDFLALDTLDSTRGAGFVEFRIDTSSATGDLDFTAMISDLSGSAEFSAQSDSGTLSVAPGSDTFVVTTAVDENDGSADPGMGAGTSLREAIIAANADPNLSTITFDASLDGTPILLTITGAGEDAAATGDLDITSEITVTGNGPANTIIDGGGQSVLQDRIFHLSTDVPFSLDGVTITGGTTSGSAISAENNSTHPVRVNNSSITGNDFGNAISFYYGRGVIQNTTIANNVSGGVAAFGSGTDVDIINSTISGNENGVSGVFSSTIRITNSTITNNSFYGVDRSATIDINNSIISGNGLSDAVAFSGSSTGSNNIIPVGNLSGLTGTIAADPLLSPLQDNGGPTLTHALFTGSPAENAGDNALAVDADSNPLTTDQRGTGFPRTTDTTVDIGAFEGTVPPATIVVTTAVDENDSTIDPGTGAGTSLREAIIAANISPDANTIVFDASLDGTPIVLTIGGSGEDAAATGDLDISTEVTITGNGSANTVIDAGGDTGIGERVLQILSSGNLTLDGVTITGGRETQEGGGIYSLGPLTIRDSTLTGNSSGLEGGALYTTGATTDISNSTISLNTSDDDGGAILADSGELTITNSTLSQNTTARNGGAIYHNYGTATITDSTISNNTAGLNGGAIENLDESVLNITNSTISGNSTSQNGGGISTADNTVVTIVDSSITGNTSPSDGGGIYQSDKATMTVTNSTISGNMAVNGSGVYSEDSTLTIADSTISNNSSTELGGGIYNGTFGDISVTNSTITGNSAGSGGGIYNDGRATVTVADSTISNNTSTTYGAGVKNQGQLNVLRSTISGNRADSGGGGIYNDDTATVINSTISGNTAVGAGGGIYNSDTITVTNSTVTDNTGSNGGGIYADDTVTVNNTIIAGNTGSDLTGDFEGSNNLVQDGSGTGLTGTVTGDPLLGPLQDNGGPTFTQAPGVGSPAIDAGDNALAVDDEGGSLINDQRGDGFPRVYPATVDIGAFEVLPPPIIIVTTEIDEDDGAFYPNLGAGTSLREAIIAANISPDANTITFDASLDGTPIVLTIGGSDEDAAATGDLDISSQLTITGNGSANTIIDAGGDTGIGDRVLQIASGVNFTLSNVTVQGGRSPAGASGGGINAGENSSLNVSDAVIADNAALENGGGIYGAADAMIVLNSVSVIDNRTSNFGGGISGDRGTHLTVIDSEVAGNDTSSIGGGLFADEGGLLSISNSTITGNSAVNEGGGIYSLLAGGDISNSTITGNTTQGIGGGIKHYGSHLEITDSTIANNTAMREGGGIHSVSYVSGARATLTVTNSTISGNSAPQGGGGIFLYENTDATVRNSIISGNTAPDRAGGGIYNHATSQLNLIDSTVADNASSYAAGISNDGSAFISGSTISGNTATYGGGGISNIGNMGIANSTISGNTASSIGGGIYSGPVSGEASLFIANSTITGNSAPSGGGGIYSYYDDGTAARTNLLNTIVAGNTSGGDLASSDVTTFTGTNNLIGDGQNAGNLAGTITGDPLLGPLQDNGGPTETHALPENSPAIDAALGEALPPDIFDRDADEVVDESDPFDQRGAGFMRVFGAGADIGAFEFSVIDYGDAPESYSTLLADDGARHFGLGPKLGALRDGELDGQPTAAADGDDNTGDNDDDGVTTLSALVVSATSETTVSFSIDLQDADSTNNIVSAWIDLDGSGTFDDGEQLISDENLDPFSGSHLVTARIPAGTSAGDKIARFRLNTDGGLDFDGEATDGEVEDYVFSFVDVSSGATVNLTDAGGETVIVIEDGDLVVLQNGDELFRAPADELGDLNIVGGTGNDIINLDDSLSPFTSNLNIDGGDGNDQINLSPGPLDFGDTDLSLTAEETNLGTDVTTTGDINLFGPVLLTTDVNVNGGNVTFHDSVDSETGLQEFLVVSSDSGEPASLSILGIGSDEQFVSEFTGEVTGISTTPEGSVFVADVGTSSIIEITPMGLPITRVDTTDAGPGNPIDFVITPAGEFLVTIDDDETSRVERFGSDGTHIGTFTNGGGRGIALSPNGTVYVSLPATESVGVYNLDGTLTDSLATGEEFSPSDIALDAAGNIYVSDQSSGDIFQFDPTGTFVGSFASELDGPLGIAFDSEGNLYVTDPEGGQIDGFGPDGSPLGTIAAELDSPLFLTTAIFGGPPQEFSLTVNSSGITEFDGPVGSDGPLTRLTTDGGGSTVLGNDITVTDTATFNDPVILDNDTQVRGNVTFESSVDTNEESGDASLNVDGDANFGGPVGSNDPLSFLGVTGTTRIDGGSITTDNGQSFVDLILESDTTLTDSTTVVIDGTIDSETGENNSLTINASAEIGGDVGGSDPLSSLTVSQDTQISTSAIETTGPQTFNGPVKFETTSELTASQVIFNDRVDGDEESGDVSLTINGDADFNETVGDDPLTDLTVNGSTNVDAQITTNGTQRFNGALTVDGTFDPNGSNPAQPVVDGDVTFESTGSFTVTIDGNTPGDKQDQIQVNGTSRTVTLDGELTVELGEDFATGSEHVIIDNSDPGSAVSGNFVGLPEGTSFDVDGTTFVITYMGGDGNDVVLLTDVTPPTADIVDVAPDPRVEDAGVVTINFDESVTGVSIGDFTLTRDDVPVELGGLSVSGEGATYTLDLSSVTGEQGTYLLTLNAAESGIRDVAGNDLEVDASDTWIFAASGAEDDGSGNVTVEDDGGDSNEDLTISSVGGNTQLRDANNAIGAGNGTTQVDPQTVEFDTPPNDVVINGGAGDDTLTIDLRGGNPLPGGTLTFNGGEAGNDTLVIIDDNGTTVISGTYTPDIVNGGDGVHTLNLAGGGTLTITFTGLEPTVISGIPNFTFLSPGSEDVITVGSIVEAGADALTVSGTSDGITFETLVLYDVDNFTIDLGTNDSAGDGTGNDQLIIAGGLDDGTDIARGLQNLTIDLGTGGTGDVDSLTISSDVDVPGTVSIDGTVINSNVSIGQSVSIEADAELSPGPGTAQLSTGDLSLLSGATLSIDIVDGTPGTGLDQVLVTGTVDVTGAVLNIDASSSTVGGGSSLVIIDNDGSDAVTGTFAGLDEGATVQVNGEAFQISYVGGDGNDVVLTNLPIVSISGPEGPVEEGDSATFTVTLNESSTDPVSVVLSINDGTATVASGDYSAVTTDGVAPTLTFAPGETSKTITIPVNADGSKEPDEEFSVSLLTGINASLNQNGGGSATATIPGSQLQIAPIADQQIAPGSGPVDLIVATASSEDSPATLSAGDLPSFVSFVDNGDGTGTFTFSPTDEGVESSPTITLTATDSNGSLDETFEVDVVDADTMLPEPPLVRINSGGGAVGNFTGDQSFNTGNRFSTRAAIDTSSVPEDVPASLFQTTRWDPRGGSELQYSIPTGPGDFQVNLYFAEIYGPTSRVGARVFDVSIEGNLELDNFDVFATAGVANKAIVESFNVTSDGTIDILFGHVVENPDVMGIEIIDLNEIVNAGPALGTINPVNVTAGGSTTIAVSASDPDGDSITLSADGLPEFVSFTDNGDGTGSFAVNSTSDDAGEYAITVQAESGEQPLTDSASFLLTVDPVVSEGGGQTAPEFGGSVVNGGAVTATNGVRIDGPSEPVAEGDDAVFTVSLDAPASDDVTVTLSVDDGSATAADGDFLPLTTAGVDPAIVFSPGEQSKLVSIETLADQEGELDETFSVSLVAASGVTIDDGNSSATATIEGGSLAVSPIGDQTIAAGTGPVDLTFSSISSDGLPAMLSADELPDYASFTDNGDGTATLTLNPTVEDTGEESIEITATDSNASVMQEFNLDVVAPDLVEQATSIFRINAAGGAVGDFSGDQFFNTGNRFSTRAGIDLSDESLPEGTPAGIFQTTRWDARGGAPLSYNIPTGEGDFEVILYFAEIYGPTSRVGARVFDVSIEGNVELDNFDVFSEAGAANRGIARRFNVVSDGTLNIDFGHVVENPNVMAIEIIDRNPIPNVGPVVAPVSDQSVDEGGTLNIPVSAFDNDGDEIMLSILGLPEFASFTDNGDGTGSIAVNPTDGDDGDFLVSVNAESGEQGLTDSTALRISVADTLDLQEDS